MTQSDKPKKNLEDLAELKHRIAQTPEWEKVRKAQAHTTRLKQLFERRLFSKNGSKFRKFDWLQDTYDRNIITHLDNAVTNYNQALVNHRAEHGVSPIPIYQLHGVQDEKNLGCRIEHQYNDERGRSTLACVPPKDLPTTRPENRRSIFTNERTIVEEKRGVISLCGFCDTPIHYDWKDRESSKHFSYTSPSFKGIGSYIFVCGEELCTDIAIVNYIESISFFNEIKDIFKKVIQGDQTDVQFNYNTHQAYERLLANCTGGRRLDTNSLSE
ncbi:hypothetical protein CEE44_03770 [Candidatus Woesearchaeota archaeon B3_Woes]|nr:MAG: hypothetical protein CEE44_03770 [Candidatus Woesearchaeota archaeon B3_Woes]